jgi:hypothetical protein
MLVFFNKISIINLIILSLIIKIVLFYFIFHEGDLSIFYRPDTYDYIGSMKSIITAGVFEIDGRPVTLRTPGYPIFLLLGHLAGGVEIISIFLQILISTLTLFYLYKLTIHITKKQMIAKIVCSLYLIEPLSLIFSSGLLLSETLLTLFVVLAVYYFLIFVDNYKTKTIITSSIFFILALYVKPVVIFLPIILSIYLLIGKFSFKHISIFLIIFFIAFGAWSYRNYIATGSFKFSTVSDVNISLNAISVLYYKHVDNVSMWNIPVTNLRREGLDFFFSNIDKDKSANDEFLKDINSYRDKNYFTIFINNFSISSKIYLTGLFKIVTGIGASDYFNAFRLGGNKLNIVKSMISILLLIQLIFTYFFFIRGRMVFNKNHIKILLLVISYFVLISSGVFGYSRFRMPVMPFIEIISGYGFYFYLIKRTAKRRLY